jgi:hypothetical protein
MMGLDLLPLLAMTVLNPFVTAAFLTAVGLYIGLRSRTTLAAVLGTLAAIAAFYFIRQYAMIPLVSAFSRYRLGPWLTYHALNLTLEAIVATVLFVLVARGIRRYVF